MGLFLKKPAYLVVIAAVAIAGGIWWSHSRHGAKLSFTTVTVKRGDVVATIGATGTIEPLEVVDVGAQVDGLIQGFGTDTGDKTVDYGSVVKQGALLAKIDDSVYAADLSVARAQVEQDKAAELNADANLKQMEAKLDQAAAEWKRAQKMLDEKLMTQVDYDTDKANYEVAVADVSAAKAGIAQAKATTVQAEAGVAAAQRNLDFCTIKSPVDGVIIDRRVNIGQTVVASLNAPSLFLIARDLTKMQIWAAVNEADVGRISPGEPVTFTVDAFPDREFTGAVGKVRLNATMTQNVVLYTVEINIENPDKLLLPYLTANVRFQLSRETNALLVPDAALRWTPSSLAEITPDARNGSLDDPPGDSNSAGTSAQTKNSRRTLWVKSGEFVRPIEVTVGISDGASTAVTADGLHEGDEVVIGEMIASLNDLKNPFLPVRQR